MEATRLDRLESGAAWKVPALWKFLPEGHAYLMGPPERVQWADRAERLWTWSGRINHRPPGDLVGEEPPDANRTIRGQLVDCCCPGICLDRLTVRLVIEAEL